MIKIAICDDEKMILDQIVSGVCSNFELLGMEIQVEVFQRGEDLLQTSNISDFEAIFLDIDLKTTNGMEIAKKIRANGYGKLIVFVTSITDYILDGYTVNAFRFILKSRMEEQLEECIRSMGDFFASKKVEMDIWDISTDDILYAESDNHRIMIYLKNGKKFSKHMTLNAFEKTLNSNDFCRVHQSYLVNSKYVESVVRYEARLTNNITVPVSKSRYKNANVEISIRRKVWM